MWLVLNGLSTLTHISIYLNYPWGLSRGVLRGAKGCFKGCFKGEAVL